MAIAVILLLLASSLYGSSAFTTAYVDRSASIDVVKDSNGFIGLSDGNSGGLVKMDGDELTIDFTSGGASGANVDAVFELGDPSNGNETYAFNITNNDDVAHTLSLNYTLDTDDADTDKNVKFMVYDSTNNKLLTATDESGEASSSTDALSSAETVHTVVVVNTTSKSSSDDLSGTLRIKMT